MTLAFTADLAVAIAFVLFLGLVFWKGAAWVSSFLDKRKEEIRRQLEDAQELREEAQKKLVENQRKQRDAQKEAEEIIKQAHRDADRLRESAEESLAATLRRREDQAVERIAQAEAQALQDIREQVVDIAIDATSRLIAGQMSAELQDRLISDATDELADKLR